MRPELSFLALRVPFCPAPASHADNADPPQARSRPAYPSRTRVPLLRLVVVPAELSFFSIRCGMLFSSVGQDRTSPLLRAAHCLDATDTFPLRALVHLGAYARASLLPLRWLSGGAPASSAGTGRCANAGTGTLSVCRARRLRPAAWNGWRNTDTPPQLREVQFIEEGRQEYCYHCFSPLRQASLLEEAGA